MKAKTLSKKEIESFLLDGAVLQTSSDLFMLFLGPMSLVQSFHSEECLIYKPHFWDFLNHSDHHFDNSLQLFRAQKVIELNRVDFFELVCAELKSHKIPEIQWDPVGPELFQIQFDWIKEKINSGQLKKGLPITMQTGGNFLPLTKLSAIKNALEKKSEQYLYGFWNKNEGFVGFTPEIFLQKKSRQIETMALAGTWNKTLNLIPDFQDLKIKNEHQIVIDDILTQLKDEKLLSKKETNVLELEYLFHLRTHLIFEHSKIEKFIYKLHPTAALGLYPRSLKLFSDFHSLKLQNRRKNFGAPFGFLSSSKSFLVVAIRNIFWENEEVSIFSGCGVTKDSQFETEWLEVEAKRNSVKRTFGLNL